MITFELISPVEAILPGSVAIEIFAYTDLESISGFTLTINEVAIALEIDDSLAPSYTLTTTFTALEDQHFVVRVLGNDGAECGAAFELETDQYSYRREPDYRVSPYVDMLLSYFPTYLSANRDTSVFRQLVNPIGLEFDRVLGALWEQGKCMSYQHANIYDPDYLSHLRMPFPHGKDEQVLQPTVVGYLGPNKLPLESTNSFQRLTSFQLPTRIGLELVSEGISSTLTASTPLVDVNSLPEISVRTDQLYMEIHSATALVDITMAPLGRTILKIIGIDPFGNEQEEDISVLRNSLYTSALQWSKISKVRISESTYNLDGELILYQIAPRNRIFPETLFRDLSGDEPEPIFWNIQTDEQGTSLMGQTSVNGFIMDVANQTDTKYAKRVSRLKDINGEDVILEDYGISQNSFYLFGISSGVFYIFDRRDIYPTSLTTMASATEDPEQTFDLTSHDSPSLVDDQYSAVISVEIERSQEQKLIRSWYWKVLDPSGEVTYISSSGETAEVPIVKCNKIPISHFGIKETGFEITVTIPGDYYISLCTEFMDNSTEEVTRLFRFKENKAIAQYDISYLYDATKIASIKVSEDMSLSLYSDGQLYKVVPKFDYFTSDADNETIYFREDYDGVQVTFINE